MANAKPIIYIIEDSSKARFGGGQKVTLEVMKALANRARLVLCDTAPGSIFYNKAEPLAHDSLVLRASGSIRGRGAAPSFSVGMKEAMFAPFQTIINAFAVRRHIRKQVEPLLIYAATKKAVLLAYLVSKMTGVPYIYHYHSMDNTGHVLFRILKPALRNARTIIAVSRAVEANIGLPCTVIYNPIELPKKRSIRSRARRPAVVVSFSTLVHWKGIDTFMESYKRLEDPSRFEFRVYGEGPERSRLEQLEQDRVRLLGFCSDVRATMQSDVDVVVVPSRGAEACPMVPLEAAALGIPVVTTDFGGQAEVVRDSVSGRTVPPNHPLGLAQAIEQVVTERGLYGRLARGARDHAGQFGIHRFKAEIQRTILPESRQK